MEAGMVRGSSRVRALRASGGGALLAAGLLLGFSGPLLAGTIEVQGTGAVEAPVVAFRFEFRLVAEKPSGAEAAKEFTAARARVDKAFAQLEIAGLEVSGDGIEVEFVDQMNDPFGGVQIVNGRPVGPESTRLVRLAEEIAVRLPLAAEAEAAGLLERIAQILDAADEVGLDPVGTPLVPGVWVQPQLQTTDGPGVFSLVVADLESVRHEAERAAIEDARRRATRIAEAAGVTLGDVQTIRVTRTASLAPAGGTFLRARQEVDLTVIFTTR